MDLLLVYSYSFLDILSFEEGYLRNPFMMLCLMSYLDLATEELLTDLLFVGVSDIATEDSLGQRLDLVTRQHISHLIGQCLRLV